MSPVRAEAERLARALGVTLVRTKDRVRSEITVEAPAGKVWVCTGDTHELVASGYTGPWGWDFLYESLLPDLRLGVAPCPTPDCEWCGGD